MTPERRAHRRYVPVETAYAALGAEFSKVGKLKNYSYGGLSFEYIDSRVRNGGNASVDVFLVDDSFHIHNLPCQVIYDFKVTPDQPIGLNLKIRRCGVKFSTTTNAQKNQIASFLSEYMLPTGSGR
jgi:hypothetical protein